MQGTQHRSSIEPSLLTAREVQGMLGVDRSTVYRMAEDGRLPALKIGRQWRFPPDQIKQLLVFNGSANPADTAESDLLPGVPAATALSLIEVAAELLGVMMVVTDMNGRPLTRVVNPCPRFVAQASDPALAAACLSEWQWLADDLDFEATFRVGALGFDCARSFVRSGTSLVGMVLAGGLAPLGTEAPDLFQLDEGQRAKVLRTLSKVAAALSRATPTGPRPPSAQSKD